MVEPGERRAHAPLIWPPRGREEVRRADESEEFRALVVDDDDRAVADVLRAQPGDVSAQAAGDEVVEGQVERGADRAGGVGGVGERRTSPAGHEPLGKMRSLEGAGAGGQVRGFHSGRRRVSRAGASRRPQAGKAPVATAAGALRVAVGVEPRGRLRQRGEERALRQAQVRERLAEYARAACTQPTFRLP